MYTTKTVNPHIAGAYLSQGDPYVKEKKAGGLEDRAKGKQLMTTQKDKGGRLF